MNRLETIAVFKAIQRLAELEDTKGIKDLADTVLKEAQTKTEREPSKED